MPIPFIPILAAGAIVGLGAAAASFIYGEMTAADKEKQSDLKQRMNHYQSQQSSILQRILDEHQITIDELMNSNEAEIQNLRNQYYKDKNQLQYEISEVYLQFTFDRIRHAKGIKKEIFSAMNRTKILIRQEKTMLRKEAMNTLLRELQIGCEKAAAYINYLYNHRELIKCHRFELEKEEFLFEFRLPDYYPYKGKLIFVNKGEVENDGFYVELNRYQSLRISIEDKIEMDLLPSNTNIPFFVTGKLTDVSYTSSVGKGMFQFTAIQQSKVGVEAKVKEYGERGKISLLYRGMELTIRARDLKNPLKLPPVGAMIRVYPVTWDALLGDPVYVSEKYEDGIKAFQFSSLPIVFNDSGADEFIDFIEQQSEEGFSDEWKIGPYKEESSAFKLQLGDFLLFKVRVELEENSYLQYEKLLPLEETFKPDDVFVVMDAEFELVLEEELALLSEESLENMFRLNMMLLNEIRIQEQINHSQEGLNFFAKWAEVTEQLIHYLSKGTEFFCELGSGTSERFKTNFTSMYRHRYEILNSEHVHDLLKKIDEGILPTFFIEQDHMKAEFDETGRFLYCYSFSPDALLVNKTVSVFAREFCYPEHQQLHALNAFREGIMLNPNLQPFMLNSENVQCNTVELPELTWKNERLPENVAQKHAVENALAEKNLYLIQGPPGTGKTTVIRELIHQQLKMSPSSRILVVSQANVAIDNVLKGLDATFEEEMIRCGNIEKIDHELAELSFEKKYKEYEQLIEQHTVPEKLKTFSNQWKALVNREDSSHAPIMGELIVRNHKIVGATCLGLMQRKIGLNRVHFDLVIIDEAGKALPAELLIPVSRAKKLIMIGDHKQLPPVIHPALYDEEKIELSEAEYCKNELFTTSLFKRLYEKMPETNKAMLNTQYRMPAVIGDMISHLFYEGQLVSHPSTKERETRFFKQHLTMINMDYITEYKESKGKQSVTNEFEAKLVTKLVNLIREERSTNEKIAIICPYRGQKRCIAHTLQKAGINLNEQNVAVNTIDAYQGDEADIVIYCMTRSQRKTKYFSDSSRLNVAFSRVKNDLVIIGSMKYLKSYGDNHTVSKIAQYVENHGEVMTLRVQPFAREEIDMGHQNRGKAPSTLKY
jgi:AAA domain